MLAVLFLVDRRDSRCQFQQFTNRQLLVRDSARDRWRSFNRLMLPAEVVPREENSRSKSKRRKNLQVAEAAGKSET